MLDGIGNGELGASFAQAGAVLGRCVDGNLEDSGGLYHLLRGGDDFLILPDCLPELLLEIAYEERWPVEPSINTFRHFVYSN